MWGDGKVVYMCRLDPACREGWARGACILGMLMAGRYYRLHGMDFTRPSAGW